VVVELGLIVLALDKLTAEQILVAVAELVQVAIT
jgi:hypothetical protein